MERSYAGEADSTQNLLFDFFLVFSHFEYSLKKAGFCKSRSNFISANWQGFAKSARSSFEQRLGENNSTSLAEAVSYLCKNPPRKQILREGTLEWEEKALEGGSKSRLLSSLDAVFRVRNNLFHGDKLAVFSSDSQQERVRRLLEYSLIIIDECLRLENEDAREVKRKFNQ